MQKWFHVEKLFSKDKIKWFCQLCLTIVLIVILLCSIDIDEYIEIINNTPIYALIVPIFVFVISVFVNAIKWKVLLSGISIKTLIFLCFRAQFFSTVFPNQIFGETSKVIISSSYSKEKLAASIAFDKATGLLAQIIIACIGMFFSGLYNPIYIGIISISFVLFFGVIMLSRISKVNMLLQKRLQSSEVGFINKLLHTVFKVVNAWTEYSKNSVMMLKSVFWGLVNQILGAASIYYLSENIGLEISFWTYCWVLTIVNLVLIASISLGGIGVRDFSFVTILKGMGAITSQSLAISSVLLIGQIVAALIGGVCILVSVFKNRGRCI